ncbi:MAG: ABC transporter ATP-binding protein [bacterium]|nr:ABC transporter ATP-binding protein [Acidimicrobiia bacterium]MCY4648974.1 ABC transporter ATP-binding protein [bacterium]
MNAVTKAEKRSRDGRPPPTLEINNLTLSLQGGRADPLDLVRGVSLEIGQGQCLGLVGESGAGKSLTAKAIVGLLPRGINVRGGSISLGGQVLTSDRVNWREVRGVLVGTIFQDPISSLNPVMRVGTQVHEVIKAHLTLNKRDRDQRVAELMEAVELRGDRDFLARYPHELSGGQQQRVAIAMAIACDPLLLIADEATTALDVRTQARILRLLRALVDGMGLSMLLVTHDVGVIASVSDRLAVLYSGRVVERGRTPNVLSQPRHPYTRGLIESCPLDLKGGFRTAVRPITGTAPINLESTWDNCVYAPRCSRAAAKCRSHSPPLEDYGELHRAACFYPLGDGIPDDATGRSDETFADRTTSSQPLALKTVIHAAEHPSEVGVESEGGKEVILKATGLSVAYREGRLVSYGTKAIPAVQEFNIELRRAETVAVVGESGSGKSTVALSLIRLEPRNALVEGRREILGEDLDEMGKNALRNIRRRAQIVFQDPYGSLNPRRKVVDLLMEGPRAHALDTSDSPMEQAGRLLERVGLDPSFADRYPHQMSGGQRQRVAIARALSVEPQVLICDEPVSALDVSIQAQILELLTSLAKQEGLAFVFITHDLGVMNMLADRVIVMKEGKTVETGAVEEVLEQPHTQYTKELVQASLVVI